MNKFQWMLIIFSVISFIDYNIFGPNLSLSSLPGIVFYLSLLLAISLFFFLAFKPKYCANCGFKLPMVRKPDGLRSTLLGGWVCPRCNSSLDSSGKVIKK